MVKTRRREQSKKMKQAIWLRLGNKQKSRPKPLGVTMEIRDYDGSVRTETI